MAWEEPVQKISTQTLQPNFGKKSLPLRCHTYLNHFHPFTSGNHEQMRKGGVTLGQRQKNARWTLIKHPKK